MSRSEVWVHDTCLVSDFFIGGTTYHLSFTLGLKVCQSKHSSDAEKKAHEEEESHRNVSLYHSALFTCQLTIDAS